ncbi:MAG: SCO family protein [Owenweeksia sp.]|nr:SCO family protein [Owenweeksia sp.]MBF98122.1 SCO family protein [Owenweeksia sp.]|tara:strand:+ start:222 stop:986 length:765 start_codon:yes stop_codon:yes gene_type:complete
MNQKLSKGVVLVSILILPFLAYFIFVYSAEENFFVTLDYVGPKKAVQVNEKGETRWDTAYYTVPDFELTSQDDSVVSAQKLRGQIYLVNFFFTTCPSICPAMNYQVKQVQDRFKGYEDFKIVSISVDPEHDSVEVLKTYAKNMGAMDGRWYFLTGNQDEIYTMAEGFFSNAMEDAEADGGYLHSENLVLVDWDGHIRSGKDDYGNIKGVYNSLSTDEINSLKDDIKVLIAEYEKKKSVDEYRMEKERKKARQNG